MVAFVRTANARTLTVNVLKVEKNAILLFVHVSSVEIEWKFMI